MHERIRGKKRATYGNKSLVPRFLSPELRQSRQQTCRFAANSSSRAEGKDPCAGSHRFARPLVSVIHHRDYFETALRGGRTVKELFPNSAFGTCPHARGGINSRGNFINDRELINDRRSTCLYSNSPVLVLLQS